MFFSSALTRQGERVMALLLTGVEEIRQQAALFIEHGDRIQIGGGVNVTAGATSRERVAGTAAWGGSSRNRPSLAFGQLRVFMAGLEPRQLICSSEHRS